MATEPWSEMTRDPRVPEHAPIRASDADRDVVLRVLAEAFADGRLDRDEFDERAGGVAAARTLGELPPFLRDLVAATPPSRASLAGIPPLDLGAVQAQAVEKWEKARRDALSAWLVTSLICWVVWAATMLGGFPWPVFPMLGTFVPVLTTQLAKKDMIASSRKRIIAKHERQVAKAERRIGRDPHRWGELGGGPPHTP